MTARLLALQAAKPTITATATATPTVVGGQAPHAASFDPTSGLAILVYSLIFVAALVVITPLLLRLMDAGLFSIPYITWYLLHYGVSALGIFAVLVLAVTGTITGEVVSALLGSLFGYVLGNAASRSSTSAQASVPPISIATPSPLPAGTVGAAYQQRLQVAGGHPPYKWSVPAGPLPSGLTLDPAAGIITGTPTTAGSSTFAIQVADSSHATAAKVMTVVVH